MRSVVVKGAVLVLTAQLAGCSLFIDGYSGSSPPKEAPRCTDSYGLPTADLVVGGVFVALGALALSVAGDFVVWRAGQVTLISGGIFGLSGLLGASVVHDCRAATSEYDNLPATDFGWCEDGTCADGLRCDHDRCVTDRGTAGHECLAVPGTDACDAGLSCEHGICLPSRP